MKSIITQQVEQARQGCNPTVICKMPSGWAVLGDDQFIHGYALLIADPIVVDLNSLDTTSRRRYLDDMVIIGDALLQVTGAYRINYETLGNLDPALHTHVLPRYLHEPEKYRIGAVSGYPHALRTSRPFDYDRDHDLIVKLSNKILTLLG